MLQLRMLSTSVKVWETFNVTTLNSISATKIASGKALPVFANNLSGVILNYSGLGTVDCSSRILSHP